MEIFGSSPEEEKKEIISDILDLYQEIINKDLNEAEKGSTVYSKEYEKILNRLHSHFQRDILNPNIPDFVGDLIEEWRSTSSNLEKRSTIITRIERGLKKIIRKSNVEIPEKIQKSNDESTPTVQNIFQASQSMNNKINISNEIKIEINQTLKEFEEEINKSNPSQSKLKKLFEIIKKGSSYGAIRLAEILMDKMLGI